MTNVKSTEPDMLRFINGGDICLWRRVDLIEDYIVLIMRDRSHDLDGNGLANINISTEEARRLGEALIKLADQKL